MAGIRGTPWASDAQPPVASTVPPLVLQEVPTPAARVFNFVDLAADPAAPPAATAVVRPNEDGTVELQGIWTSTTVPIRVVVRRFVTSLADALRASGFALLTVTVRAEDVERTAAFEEGGFRRIAGGTRSPELLRLELAL